MPGSVNDTMPAPDADTMPAPDADTMPAPDADTMPAGETTPDLHREIKLVRGLTWSDKSQLRILVDKGYDIPGIIPTVYYERRFDTRERGSEYISGIRSEEFPEDIIMNKIPEFEYQYTNFEIDVSVDEIKRLEAEVIEFNNEAPVEQEIIESGEIQSTPPRKPYPANGSQSTVAGASAYSIGSNFSPHASQRGTQLSLAFNTVGDQPQSQPPSQPAWGTGRNQISQESPMEPEQRKQRRNTYKKRRKNRNSTFKK
jgi:hypothetical protein